MKAVRVRALVERKATSLPRFVVVPSSPLKAWRLEGTTPVEVAAGGVSLGRRNLKRWGKGRDCWFIDLSDSLCRRAGVDTGDRITLELRKASEALPTELSRLLENSETARRAWAARTASQQRMLADNVRAARQSSTRARRAAKALLSR